VTFILELFACSSLLVILSTLNVGVLEVNVIHPTFIHILHSSQKGTSLDFRFLRAGDKILGGWSLEGIIAGERAEGRE
jgi:hypothetical protein